MWAAFCQGHFILILALAGGIFLVHQHLSQWTAVRLYTDGVERLKVSTTETIINEDGADNDTRFEGDTDANLFKLDASTDRIGIGVASPGDKFAVAGNVALTTAGNKLKIATGANASVGTSTLVGGTVTVSTTAVTTSSLIYVTVNTPGGTQGFLSVPSASIVDATSFVINSTSGTETSTVNWWIVN
jgi:uncharacterized membrane protein